MKKLEEIIREKINERQRVLIDGQNTARAAMTALESHIRWESKDGDFRLYDKMRDLSMQLRRRAEELDTRLQLHLHDYFEISNELNFANAAELLKEELAAMLEKESNAFELAALTVQKDECDEITALMNDAQAEFQSQNAAQMDS